MAPTAGLSSFTVWDATASSCGGIDVERPHHTFGFDGACSSGAGQERRAALFHAYATGLPDTFPGLFDLSAPQAWAEVNEILEGADVSWAYLRAATDNTFFTARGSC